MNVDVTTDETITEYWGMFDFVQFQKPEDMRVDQRLKYFAQRDAEDLARMGLEFWDVSYDAEDDTATSTLLSDTMEYYISGKYEKDGKPSYIGCISKERGGNRGNDLEESLLTEKGWACILNDIQYYESMIGLEK